VVEPTSSVFQGELELAGVVSCRRLSAVQVERTRIAELVYCANVGVVEELNVSAMRSEAEAFAEANALGDAKIELEEIGHGEICCAEVADATKRRSDAGNRKGLACVGEANGRPGRRQLL